MCYQLLVFLLFICSSTTGFCQGDSGLDYDDIEDNVRSAIQNDSDLSFDARNVNVRATSNGTVTLTGIVDSQEEQAIVQSLASQVDGVNNVINKTTITNENFGDD